MPWHDARNLSSAFFIYLDKNAEFIYTLTCLEISGLAEMPITGWTSGRLLVFLFSFKSNCTKNFNLQHRSKPLFWANKKHTLQNCKCVFSGRSDGICSATLRAQAFYAPFFAPLTRLTRRGLKTAHCAVFLTSRSNPLLRANKKHTTQIMRVCFLWSEWRDLNPWPHGPERRKTLEKSIKIGKRHNFDTKIFGVFSYFRRGTGTLFLISRSRGEILMKIRALTYRLRRVFLQ